MNLLSINYSDISKIPIGKVPQVSFSLDKASLVRDENGQLFVSGTFNDMPVYQEIYISSYPSLIVFDIESTNFFVVTDLRELDPSHLIVDIFTDEVYLP